MKKEKINWFVRSLIIGLCILIATLVCYSFFIAEPKGIISNGIIILLLLLIILVLSEAFDNIALGKILSLNRKIEEKKEEVIELKSEKQNLLNMLVNNISVQSQSVGISGHDLKEILTVIKADPERIKQETEEKESDIKDAKIKTNERKRIDFRKLESSVLTSFIETNNLQGFLFNEQVTFSKNFSKVDPISNINPVFDGYIETDDSEIFVEIKLQRIAFPIREQLYSRLSALYYYRQAKKIKAHLQLILVELPEDEDNGRVRNTEEKLREQFEPAIDKNLLRIKYVKITEKEAEELYRE